VAILGCGHVGRALAVELLDAKRPTPFRGELRVWSRSARSIARLRKLLTPQTRRPWRVANDADEAAAWADVVIVSLADKAIEPTVHRLAQSDRAIRAQVVLITNGYLPLSCLEGLRRRGCAVGRLHPLAPIPTDMELTALIMVAWGVEGDARAVRTAKELVVNMQGKALLLRRHRGAAGTYHAAASLLSGGMVALFHLAERVMSESVTSRAVLRDALDRFGESTLDNIYACGPREALTGALSRGSESLVRGHVRALRKVPEALELYRLLGGTMLELAHARRSIDARALRRLRALLGRRRDSRLDASARMRGRSRRRFSRSG
jgi:predicted short-subunit dehydrogenase-like oxidoreductase (DUF2520 family)